MEPGNLLADVQGFAWDEHNEGKIWRKHLVQPRECEEIFMGEHVIARDPSHSQAEERFFAFGSTTTGRRLTVVFTIREARIRVVSARDQSRRERKEPLNG